jgi:hypothetical protein
MYITIDRIQCILLLLQKIVRADLIFNDTLNVIESSENNSCKQVQIASLKYKNMFRRQMILLSSGSTFDDFQS